MQTFLHGRDLIGDLDFSKEEVETVLDVAWDLKRKRALNEPHPYLRDKVLAMLFFFSSTRTRGSFEAGMAQLGGHGAFRQVTQIAHEDTPKEIGEITRAVITTTSPSATASTNGGTSTSMTSLKLRASPSSTFVRRLPSLPVPGRPDGIMERKAATCAKKIVVSWAYAASAMKPICCRHSF